MSEKFQSKYYTPEQPREIVAEVTIPFFNQLGEYLYQQKQKMEAGQDVDWYEYNPIYVRHMMEIGNICTTSGSFNCGKESVVARTLFGLNSMSYSKYFESLYELLTNLSKKD